MCSANGDENGSFNSSRMLLRNGSLATPLRIRRDGVISGRFFIMGSYLGANGARAPGIRNPIFCKPAKRASVRSLPPVSRALSLLFAILGLRSAAPRSTPGFKLSPASQAVKMISRLDLNLRGAVGARLSVADRHLQFVMSRLEIVER